MPPTRRARLAEAIRQMIRDDNGLTIDEDGTRRLPPYPVLRGLLGADRPVGTSTVSTVIVLLKAEGWLEDGESGVAGVPVRRDHPS